MSRRGCKFSHRVSSWGFNVQWGRFKESRLRVEHLPAFLGVSSALSSTKATLGG